MITKQWVEGSGMWMVWKGYEFHIMIDNKDTGLRAELKLSDSSDYLNPPSSDYWVKDGDNLIRLDKVVFTFSNNQWMVSDER